LVAAGLLDRQESKVDRRRVELTLTTKGEELVTRVMDHRRAALVRILEHVSPEKQAALASALDAFSESTETVSGTSRPSL